MWRLLLLLFWPVSSGLAKGVCSGAPSTVYYEIVAAHHHSVERFTQGLEFGPDGALLESSGGYGRSRVFREEFNGRAGLMHTLPDWWFAEGLTVVGNDIWLLSWRAGRYRVLSRERLEFKHGGRYQGEGWGLTSDGRLLFMSSGSARIQRRRLGDFSLLGTFTVRDGNRRIERLNELEWVAGEIYANIWGRDEIVRFDPDTGCVTGWLDLTDLWPKSQRPARADVLNGIALHPDTGHLWVTGKYWPRYFELRVFEADSGQAASRTLRAPSATTTPSP